MKTRKTTAKAPSQEQSDSSASVLIPEQDPVRLLLLPSKATPEARICTLTHPATSKPCRFYLCPIHGIYEFQRIAAPKKDCRSWLLGKRVVAESSQNRDADLNIGDAVPTDQDQAKPGEICWQDMGKCASEEGASIRSVSQGHTIKNPEIFIATPIDPLFLVLPVLHAEIQKNTKGLFLLLDDILESAGESSKHLKHVTLCATLQRTFKTRMAAVCDTVEAGYENMYRLNLDKLVAELVAKAKRIVTNGLPATMETKFVTKALETPVMSLKREDTSVSQSANSEPPDNDSQCNVNAESQSSTVTGGSIVSKISEQTDLTTPDAPPSPPVPENIRHLLRLRIALHFILASYVPPTLATSIKNILSSTSTPVDFGPLDAHLDHLNTLRAQAQASRSLSDFSRKRNMIEDDEAAEAKAEKRRKKEEEDKRQKASQTKGIRDLKKVDVKGMKKMSDFFGKGAVVRKK
ncbi:MAG: hypothetical protein LQ346_009035 [Caloplaca aetnensis]|nr:MAG: hypothetical protein LQ346_009035 [Caloplaca aetnensis]